MAMNLNKALLIGNLTRDPESRKIPSGQAVTTFAVATNRRWTDRQSGEKKDSTEFHNCVAWGKLADIVGQYLKKGSKVYIEGRIQTRSWDDQSGVKKYRTEIIAENLIMLDRAGAAPSGGAPQASAEPAAPKDEEEINVEDIPF